MIVCKHCLNEIESHEGSQIKKKIDYFDSVEIVYGYYDEEGNFIKDENSTEEYLFCEWCEEYIPLFEMYEI